MTDNFANELAKASGITNKIEYTGSIGIGQPKPNYNVTFTNGEKTIGRIDMNGDEMTFEGDADASAKKFMDFLAGYFGQRLKEEREKERDKFWDALMSDLEHGVKSLNERASERFAKEYPALNREFNGDKHD